MFNLYEFAVICDEKRDRDDEVVEAAEILVGPKAIVARSEEQAQVLAARSIPETHLDRIDRLTVVVRPF
jgi:hypothetical protein